MVYQMAMKLDMVWDAVSVSLLAYVIFPFIVFIATGSQIYFLLFVGMITTAIVVKLLKILFYKHKRPKGACDCDIFNSKGSAEEHPGMPSGHVATLTFFFVFLWILSWQNGEFTSIIDHVLFIAIASLLIAAMGMARYYKKCHNTMQIVAGIVVGTVIAITYMMLWYRMKNHLRK